MINWELKEWKHNETIYGKAFCYVCGKEAKYSYTYAFEYVCSTCEEHRIKKP